MKEEDTTTPPRATSAEPANVIVEALENRVKIGKALVAKGRVDFTLTMSQARDLKDAGLVRIVGIV